MPRIVAAGLFVFALTSHAAGEINVDSSGFALKGYDPVAYFTQKQPIQGKAEFTARHEGAIYRFASAANRDAFVAAPEKYAPQYGGYCAFGAASGYKAPIEPDAWTIVEGKLYLNYNQSVRSRWASDIPRLYPQGGRAVAGNTVQVNLQMRKMGSVPIIRRGS